MSSLYTITSKTNELVALITDNGGELTENDEQILTGLQNELIVKTDSIVSVHKKMNDHIGLIDQRVKELQELKRIRVNERERFESYVDQCMTALGTEKIEGDFGKISYRKMPESVEITDDKKITDNYKITTVDTKISVAQIKADLKNGVEVEGAKLTKKPSKITFK